MSHCPVRRRAVTYRRGPYTRSCWKLGSQSSLCYRISWARYRIGTSKIIDPLDPYNGLRPFITSCCSDFQDAFSPAGSRDLPPRGLAFNLCIGFVVLADQVNVPDSSYCARLLHRISPFFAYNQHITRSSRLRATLCRSPKKEGLTGPLWAGYNPT